MGRRIWDNLGTVLIALALAILVWIIALNEVNPIEDKPFAQPVPINLINTPPNMLIVGNVANPKLDCPGPAIVNQMNTIAVLASVRSALLSC